MTLFESFFKREFAADEIEEVSKLIEQIGLSKKEYLKFLEGDGAVEFEACLDEAADDHIFGVPIFVFNGEQFWGADRIWLLEETLANAGLAKSDGS
jgi:2-hydroxychromene-2-carboxylate isomerase